MDATKRFGNIMMGFIPIISGIGLQFLLSVPAVGIVLLYAMTSSNGRAADNPMEYYIDLVSDSQFSTSVCVLYALTVIAIFGFWYYKVFAKESDQPVKKAFHPLMIPALILAAVAWQYLAQYIAVLTAALSPRSLDYYETLMETAGFDDMSLLLILYAVILGPICEELLFRGVTLGFAKRAMPFWLANTFQAVLFGAFHMNVIQGVYAFFLGLVMGLICKKCGNIIFSMAFHILYNGWATFAPDFMMYKAEEMPFFVIWLAVGILLAVLSAVIFAIAFRKHRESAREIQEEVNFSN